MIWTVAQSCNLHDQGSLPGWGLLLRVKSVILGPGTQVVDLNAL